VKRFMVSVAVLWVMIAMSACAWLPWFIPDHVEGGIFQMGDEVGDIWAWCRPAHKVNLTYNYWIGKYEVTFDEYDAYCVAMRKRLPSDEGWGRGTRPVINVSWWDAIGYCNWLSEKEGYAPAYDQNGNLLDRNGIPCGRGTTDISKVEGYRLPTEAEWEYAARGGQKQKQYLYAGSNDLDEVGWCICNSGSKTHSVGEKKANSLGLYDMSGNVWEWCYDWWDEDYYSEGDQINPIGPDSSVHRAIRGGCWGYLYFGCRVAFRGARNPMGRSEEVGFRLVRTLF